MKQIIDEAATPRWLQPREPGRKIQRAWLREAGVFRNQAARVRRLRRQAGLKPLVGTKPVITVTNPNKDRQIKGKGRRNAARAGRVGA